MHASATSFEEIKLILHPDDSEVPSYENAYGVRWSVIEYSHMVTSSASWSGVRGTIGKSEVAKVEESLNDKKGKRGGDWEVQKMTNL